MIRKFMIVVLSLLCFASPVSAGCAWVLWKQTETMRDGNWSTSWEVVSAEETKAPCQTKAENVAAVLAKNLGGEVKNGTVVSINTNNEIFIFKCIPDTVNPRT